MQAGKKNPLYRKVNTKARYCHHYTGPDARHTRNTKAGLTKKMKRGVQRGLDYTPLFKFLLSKVGQKWDDVYSEAKSRLNVDEPVFWMVQTNINHSDRGKNNDTFRGGENAIYSKLIVDENGLLQYKNPKLKNEDFYPSCSCCTHTFNGTVLQHTYQNFNQIKSENTQ